MKIKTSPSQRVFDVLNVVLMLIIAVIMIYPMWYVLCASFSNSNELLKLDGVLFKPLGFNAAAYKSVVENPLIRSGFVNTFIIVIAGVFLNIIMTSIAAYFLSRKNVYTQKFFMKAIVFTMYFSGGLIPTYILVAKTLHLNNSLLAIILPATISTYNMIIMRTSFLSIPDSLTEAATIDGAGHVTILFRIILPLSKAIIAVMILYYAVGHWNGWFMASIYLKDKTKYPVQLVLREILIQNDVNSMMDSSSALGAYQIGESIKYAVIVVSTIPILIVYPFLQKYFTKGVMVGAVKG